MKPERNGCEESYWNLIEWKTGKRERNREKSNQSAPMTFNVTRKFLQQKIAKTEITLHKFSF